MNHTDSYYNYLLECAKSGSDSSFVELCELLHQDIFCTAFQLVDDYDLAFDITNKTFDLVYKNMSRYEGKKSCSFWIREITIILCFFQLKEKQSRKPARTITYDHMAKIEENPVEEAYTTLSFYQKIAVILASKLKFSLYDMRNVFEDLSETEVRDLYQDAIYKLTRSSPRLNLNTLSEEKIQNIVNAEERGDIKLSGLDKPTLNSIKKFKRELNDIFTRIKPDPSLIEEIKEKFSFEDEEQTEPVPKILKEKEPKNSKYENAIKSTLDDFFVKRKLFLSSKKIKKSSLAGHLNKSVVGILAILLGSLVFMYSIKHLESNSPWKIQAKEGHYEIAGEDNSTLLYENGILKSESGSDLSVFVEEMGEFNIKGQAEFRLEKARQSDNRIRFKGKYLKFSSVKKPNIIENFDEDSDLTINLDNCSLVSGASEFTIQNSIRFNELFVEKGWVKVLYENEKLVLLKGYWKDLNNNLSVPVYKESSGIVKSIATNPTLLSLKLKSMLPELKKYDLLTLWHLMNLVQDKDRDIIIDKIEELLPEFDRSSFKGLRRLENDDVCSLLDLIRRVLVKENF